MEGKWRRLQEIDNELADLSSAAAVLGWDQQTYMPPGGAQARAEQRATLMRLVHQRITSPEVGDLLSELEAGAASLDPERRALLREARRHYDQAVKVPAALVAELERTTATALDAWVQARRERDYALFKPHLARVVALSREKAEALGFSDSPYDALLDLYEPGIKRADIERVFEELRGTLVPLLQAIVPKVSSVDDAVLRRPLPADRQLAFAKEVVARLGFDFSRGRLDLSEHPFTTAFAPGDVRLTTRIDPSDLRVCLYAAIHEAGHGMYEQGIAERFARSVLGHVPSLGLHESQSRLWENVIGRSREFWIYFLPVLQRFFPGAFDGADVDAVYRAVNRVEPSLIRTEADEVTYNLHIMLRFELERALIDGTLSVDDLPDAWDAKMQEYLTVRPPTVLEGVLQDVHWAIGSIGYFPTYTLGTVLSVQLYQAALAEHPEIPKEVAHGEFGTVLRWFREKMHVHGSLYTPRELVRRITGTDLQTGPYLRYIETKYREIYNL